MVKKQIEEAKAEMAEEVNGNLAEEAKTPEPFTAETVPQDKSIGIRFNKLTNKHEVYEAILDVENGTLGGIRIVEANPQKYIVVERFQVLAGKNFL